MATVTKGAIDGSRYLIPRMLTDRFDVRLDGEHLPCIMLVYISLANDRFQAEY